MAVPSLRSVARARSRPLPRRDDPLRSEIASIEGDAEGSRDEDNHIQICVKAVFTIIIFEGAVTDWAQLAGIASRQRTKDWWINHLEPYLRCANHWPVSRMLLGLSKSRPPASAEDRAKAIVDFALGPQRDWVVLPKFLRDELQRKKVKLHHSIGDFLKAPAMKLPRWPVLPFVEGTVRQSPLGETYETRRRLAEGLSLYPEFARAVIAAKDEAEFAIQSRYNDYELAKLLAGILGQAMNSGARVGTDSLLDSTSHERLAQLLVKCVQDNAARAWQVRRRNVMSPTDEARLAQRTAVQSEAATRTLHNAESLFLYDTLALLGEQIGRSSLLLQTISGVAWRADWQMMPMCTSILWSLGCGVQYSFYQVRQAIQDCQEEDLRQMGAYPPYSGRDV